MIRCEICKKEFKNNLGGNLTVHLHEQHGLSMEDYVILTKNNNIEPKCECGFCNERPLFYRGNFSKYALHHNTFDWLKNKYIENNGYPKCKNENCNNNVSFYRGYPRMYCSHKCCPSQWNQEKVKKTNNEKYGVDSVLKLQSVRNKIVETNNKKYGVDYHQLLPSFNDKLKSANIKKYGIKNPQILPEFILKKQNTLLNKYGVDHYSKTEKFRENASLSMCKTNTNQNNNYKIKTYKSTKIYYQSLYECRFLELCENKGILHEIDNSPTFHYLNSKKWHLPDFKFKNKYIIEIKSSYWLKRQGGMSMINAKKESVESLGYIYLLFLDENYQEFLKFI